MTTEIKKQEPITNEVLAKVEQLKQLGQLILPEDYHAQNALKSAQIILNDMSVGGKSVMEVCTKSSIGNALFEMVTQGLSPMKKQCAFIVRGNKLCMEREYPGSIALAKRLAKVKNIYPKALFKDDDFEYETDIKTGATIISKHKPRLENRKKENLIGAFAIVLFEDGSTDACVMSMEEIKTSWLQGPTKGNSPAHRNFPDQMAEKTVSNRALKRYIDGSVDDYDTQDSGDYKKSEQQQSVQQETIDVQAEVVQEQVQEVVEEPIIVIDTGVEDNSQAGF